LKAHDVKWGTTFANDKFAVSAAGQLLKENDWTVNASGAYETKPAKKEWKATGSATVTSPDFSGVKAHINVSTNFMFVAHLPQIIFARGRCNYNYSRIV
jgi:hypothetical protein